jgi:hypothetical protein
MIFGEEPCVRPAKKTPQAGDRCPNHPDRYVVALSRNSVKPFCGECDWNHTFGSCNACHSRVACVHWDDYRTRYTRFWEFDRNLAVSYEVEKEPEEKIPECCKCREDLGLNDNTNC